MASSSSSSYVPLGFDEDDDEYANMDYEQEGESSGIGVGGRFRRDGCIFIPPDGIKGMGSPIFIIVNEAGELIEIEQWRERHPDYMKMKGREWRAKRKAQREAIDAAASVTPPDASAVASPLPAGATDCCATDFPSDATPVGNAPA